MNEQHNVKYMRAPRFKKKKPLEKRIYLKDFTVLTEFKETNQKDNN